jgi:predicted MFS family arabinose efflux permease
MRLRPQWWSYNYTVLLITWLGWITIYLAKSVLPPILPVLSAELGLTYAQSGLLETAYLIGYVLIKVPVGGISQRLGAKKVLAASMVGYAASTFLISAANNLTQIFILRFLVGLFQGVHLPVANALLSDRFGSKQGRAIGFNESGANVGNTLAFPLAVSLLSLWGWRTAFMIMSLPAFLLALATFAWIKSEEGINEEKTKSNGSIWEYKKALIPLALGHATYNIVLRSTFTFIPSFLVDSKGMGIATAGYIATILPFAGIFAKLVSGFLFERFGSRNSITGGLALSALFFFGLVWMTGRTQIGLNLMVLGLTLYCFSPIIYASTTSMLPPNLKPVGLGVVTMFGNIVGAISTSVVGILIDYWGFGIAFTAIAGVTLVSSAVIRLSVP